MDDEKSIIDATDNLVRVGEDINRLMVSIDQLHKSIMKLDRGSESKQISVLFGLIEVYGTSITILREKLQTMKDG